MLLAAPGHRHRTDRDRQGRDRRARHLRQHGGREDRAGQAGADLRAGAPQPARTASTSSSSARASASTPTSCSPPSSAQDAVALGEQPAGDRRHRHQPRAAGRRWRWSEPDRPTYVIFLTDGLPDRGRDRSRPAILANVGERAPENVRLFAFGVGDDVDTYPARLAGPGAPRRQHLRPPGRADRRERSRSSTARSAPRC